MADLSDEQFQELKRQMIDEGIIIDTMTNPDGSQSFRFDMEKLAVLHPWLHDDIKADQEARLEKGLSVLVDMGLVDMSFTEEEGIMKPIYKLSEKGQAFAENFPNGLT